MHVQPSIICRWQYMWYYRYRVMPLFDVTVSFRYRIMWTRSLPLLAYFSHLSQGLTMYWAQKPHHAKISVFFSYGVSEYFHACTSRSKEYTAHSLPPWFTPPPPSTTLTILTRFSSVQNNSRLLCEVVCSKTKYLVGKLLSVICACANLCWLSPIM